MREMPSDQVVLCFSNQPLRDPVRWIIRLKFASRGELGQGITRSPEGFCRLLRSELAAVPDDGGFDEARGGGGGEAFDVSAASD